jgi:hypothetical protein
VTVTIDPLPDWPTSSRETRIEIVKPLWDSGLSASQIMFHFVGASRNAVIGLIHRNGWQRSSELNRLNNGRHDLGKRKAAPNPPKRIAKPKMQRVEPSIPSERPDWIHTERPPLAGTTPVSILALPYNPGTMCRFPVKGGYCGQHSGDEMYCEPHRRFMYSDQKLKADQVDGRQNNRGPRMPLYGPLIKE